MARETANRRKRYSQKIKDDRTNTAATANERSIPPTAPINETRQQKEVKTMAERETGGGESLADFANSTLTTVRDIAARYIDASASFAKQIVDFQAQTTSWAKDTPMGPMFQSQYSFNQGLIELWVKAARALWRIQEAKPEPDGGL